MAFSAIIGDGGTRVLGHEHRVWRAAAQQTTIILNDLFELTVMLRHYSGIRRGTRKDAPEPEPTA